MINNQLAIIIIAAGNSSRLGTEKQLVKFKGKTLLNNTIDLALNFSTDIVCILGHDADRVKLKLQISDDHYYNKPDFITNHNWQQGMGSSIAKGCKYFCNQEKKFNGAMIMLCDQYLLLKDDLQQLVHRWQKHPDKIIASEYFEKKKNKLVVGAPAIFPKQYFDSLKMLKEKGAKKILEKNERNRITIPLINAAIDLDTKSDLKTLLEKEHD